MISSSVPKQREKARTSSRTRTHVSFSLLSLFSNLLSLPFSLLFPSPSPFITLSLQDLTSQLASSFSLRPGQVQVVASRPGSVIADVIIGPVLPFTSLPASQAAHIISVLRATAGSNGNSSSNSTAQPLHLPGFNAISVLSLTPPETTQPDGKAMPPSRTPSSLNGLLLLLRGTDLLSLVTGHAIHIVQSSCLTLSFTMTILCLHVRNSSHCL